MTDKLIPLRILFCTMAAGRMYNAGVEVELPESIAKTLLDVRQAEIATDNSVENVIEEAETETKQAPKPAPKTTKPQGANK